MSEIISDTVSEITFHLTLVDMDITSGFGLPVYMADVPHVSLTVNNCIEKLFIVDTGATASYVSYDVLVTLCLQFSLEPCNPEYLPEGSVKVKLTEPTTGDLISEEFRLWYTPKLRYTNVLGLDFLKSTCSVLDLNAEDPRLRLYRYPKSSTSPGAYSELLLTEVCVNGFKTNVVLDTGSSGAVFICPHEVASELQLTIEETEPIKTETFHGILKFNTIARNVTVQAYGRQVTGDAFIGILDETYRVVGLPVLLGATITFFESGDWDITYPGRT